MGILGIDTSCYTTSVAYVEDGHAPEQVRRILQVQQGGRGLMQSAALFQHVQNLPEIFAVLRENVPGMHIDAVCASTKPRPVEGSYMPVFTASAGLARSIASASNIPFIPTTHQQGHVRAALYGSAIDSDDFLAIHLSGGTTELLHTGHDLHIELLGGTLDLNAGQFVDRIGVALGLPFPAGPHLEQLAEKAIPQSRLPLSCDKLGVHFSGAEAQALRWIEAQTYSPEQIAAEVYSYITRAIAYLIIAGSRETGLNDVLLAGGVASSARFRRMLPERLAKKGCSVRVHWGKPEYSADNAVGVALIGQDIVSHRRER